MNKKSIRGQVEIFGLAFIVILISIGFFIYVSHKASTKADNPQKEFTDDKLPSDFILSILEVNAEDCPEFTIKDLIVDCARDRAIECGSYPNSCLAVNDTIVLLLNQTFDVRGARYRFYSENLDEPIDLNALPPISDPKELFNISRKNCNEKSLQGQAGSAIISLYPDPRVVKLNMNICH